ncbi:TetR/AcrR family transcriptional regulator [Pseudonocardia kunmingensis]|uniref:TetR/AcrR family transcriptional regulator n=1 Tax=Pseudonocardia kunmingensis TaxID=630975 RepID=UPI00114F5C84|nr:TetR/AcrR family transcriptional regulator [Pseudonocardia kunmingensis]
MAASSDAVPPRPGKGTPARAERRDGRALRSERTRQALVDAHVALLLEGDLQPTAARVAERAGVSIGAFWFHFKDIESLFAESGAKIAQSQEAARGQIPLDLPLAERIELFCQQRAKMLEAGAGMYRAAQARLSSSRQLQINRIRHTARLRSELEELFAGEIAAAGSAGNELSNALQLASTWPSWMGCRDYQGLSVEESAAVMRRMMTALLVAASTKGD